MGQIFADKNTQDKFDSEGIVSVPLLSNEEVLLLQDIYNRDFSNPTPQSFHSTMFVNDADFRRKTDEAIRHVIIKKINDIILNYRVLFANFIVKESAADTKVGIHQDWNFTLPEYISLNIWIPLSDINQHTGIFYGLKGSHKKFRNIRYTPYADNAYSPLEDYILQSSTPFEVKAGEALIYNGALVHFSQPNISGKVRIAIGLALIPAATPSLHYFKPNKTEKLLEVYETDEAFYHSFNFLSAPMGVKKTGVVTDYYELPSISELMKQS